MVCNKLAYNTRYTGWKMALKFSSKYLVPHVPYKCPRCKKIHLTTRPGSVKGITMSVKVRKKLAERAKRAAGIQPHGPHSSDE